MLFSLYIYIYFVHTQIGEVYSLDQYGLQQRLLLNSNVNITNLL